MAKKKKDIEQNEETEVVVEPTAKKAMPWKKRLVQVLWVVAGISVVVLFSAAMQKKSKQSCSNVNIEIEGADKHMFIDEKDIMDIVNKQGDIKGLNIASVDLRSMEESLEKNPWVKNAELFFDNKQVLNISITERQPVARVFTMQGSSFYLDSAGVRLPLSDKLSARVPVFTSFPSDNVKMASIDSAVMKGIVELGKYIVVDSFWSAQIAQIDITPQATFELIPVIGDQVVAFGKATDIDNKFNRLYTFYQQAWVQNGINKYEKLDVQFNNQVVAVKRGTGKTMIDSAKAAQMVATFMSQTGNVADSSNTMSVEQVNRMSGPPKRDSVKAITPTVTRVVTNKPVIAKPATTPVKKPTTVTSKPVVKPNTKPVVKPAAKPTNGVKQNTKPATTPKKPGTKPATNTNKPTDGYEIR